MDGWTHLSYEYGNASQSFAGIDTWRVRGGVVEDLERGGKHRGVRCHASCGAVQANRAGHARTIAKFFTNASSSWNLDATALWS